MLESREEAILTIYSREWQRFSRAVHRIDAACMYVNKLTKLVVDESFPEHRKSFVVHVEGRRMELRPKPIGPLGLYLWKYGVLLHSRDEHQNMILERIMKALIEQAINEKEQKKSQKSQESKKKDESNEETEKTSDYRDIVRRGACFIRMRDSGPE